MTDYHHLPKSPTFTRWQRFKLRCSFGYMWGFKVLPKIRWLKGEFLCRYRHKPLMRGVGGYGGRDVWGRRRQAYSDMRCIVCGNHWDTTRPAKPLTRHQEHVCADAFGNMWVGNNGNFTVSDVSPDDIDAIEEMVGMANGGWDFCDPKELVAACWTRLAQLQRNGERRAYYSKS